MMYDSVVFLTFISDARCLDSIGHEHWKNYKVKTINPIMLFYHKNNFIKKKIYGQKFSGEIDNKYFLLFANCDNLNIPTKDRFCG